MFFFCQWKVGGVKKSNRRHQKAKGNIWRVMFTNVFSPFFSEMCAAVSVACWEWEQCLSEINTTERQTDRQKKLKVRNDKGEIKTVQKQKI